MYDVPRGFCLIPWIHAHVTAQGRRKLCCVDSINLGDAPVSADSNLKDYWNSQEMKQVRRQMLAGELLQRCNNCSQHPIRAVTYRDQMLARWHDWIGPAIAATSADGSTSLEPFTFDYRSSTCNLKCRICGPRYSTTLEMEIRRNPELQQFDPDPMLWGKGYMEARSSAQSIARDELLAAARAGTIRHLYWAGGEPLFDETHWSVMNELVRTGNARHVDVVYNTNLTMLKFKGQTVADIWPHFPHVTVQASIDGVGAAGEYIRSGFSTAHFSENMDALAAMAQQSPTIAIVLDVTLTSLGLLHLGDLLQFAVDRRLGVTSKLMFPRKVTNFMAVEFLPQAVKDDWCRRWMDWIIRNDHEKLLDALYDTLDIALRRRSFDAATVAAGAGSITVFEKTRGDQHTYRKLLEVDDRLVNFLPIAETAGREQNIALAQHSP
ncbi:twitch domain-containing radical SAM protein [Shinella sp. M27]|uniref:twitch domain-containing radical SAM protein n=1 Tax=Shinella sp. M27 TaxID=3368614 RepID=UPI003BA0D42F